MSDCKDSCEELPKGIRGPRGYQGEKGIQGDKGDMGETGPQGPPGNSGLTGSPGPQGLAITGPLGPPGVQGPAGADGANGINGVDGLNGPQGEPGEKGPAGDAGTPGDYVDVTLPVPNDANFKCGGIVVTHRNGLTDGEISVANIKNGCNGFDGRGVAVFVGGVTSQFVGGGGNGEPTEVVYQATYAGVPGFTVNFVDTTILNPPGSYNANRLRPGDIWIKD
jgi:hypothetical protein